ncbi:MAG: uncharacterized protein KVP18_005051 [Porospora cf. gigantea A]|uniref:uncharacterized protein n=1 Tax=Porospora cf. gigantea A TaxID=2853593 RepID=UPI00355AAF09|nr:MAG: hypothetical protein KVP18_005051 [Porospora cf. gigantea A]
MRVVSILGDNLTGVRLGSSFPMSAHVYEPGTGGATFMPQSMARPMPQSFAPVLGHNAVTNVVNSVGAARPSTLPLSTRTCAYPSPPTTVSQYQMNDQQLQYHVNSEGGQQCAVNCQQFPMSGQYPVSAQQYPVSAQQYPVSAQQYSVSAQQYPGSSQQYPGSAPQHGGQQFPGSAPQHGGQQFLMSGQYPVSALHHGGQQYAISCQQFAMRGQYPVSASQHSGQQYAVTCQQPVSVSQPLQATHAPALTHLDNSPAGEMAPRSPVAQQTLQLQLQPCAPVNAVLTSVPSNKQLSNREYSTDRFYSRPPTIGVTPPTSCAQIVRNLALSGDPQLRNQAADLLMGIISSKNRRGAVPGEQVLASFLGDVAQRSAFYSTVTFSDIEDQIAGIVRQYVRCQTSHVFVSTRKPEPEDLSEDEIWSDDDDVKDKSFASSSALPARPVTTTSTSRSNFQGPAKSFTKKVAAVVARPHAVTTEAVPASTRTSTVNTTTASTSSVSRSNSQMAPQPAKSSTQTGTTVVTRPHSVIAKADPAFTRTSAVNSRSTSQGPAKSSTERVATALTQPHVTTKPGHTSTVNTSTASTSPASRSNSQTPAVSTSVTAPLTTQASNDEGETPHGDKVSQQVTSWAEEVEKHEKESSSGGDFGSETSPVPFDMTKKKRKKKKTWAQVDLRTGCAYCSGGCSMCNPLLRDTSDSGHEAASNATSTPATARITTGKVKFIAMKSSVRRPAPLSVPPVMFPAQTVDSTLDPTENPTPCEAKTAASKQQRQADMQKQLNALTAAEKSLQTFDFGDLSSLAPEEAGRKLTSFCTAVHAYLCLLIQDQSAVGKIVGVMAANIQENKDISSFTGQNLLPGCVTILEALHASNQLLNVSTERLKERLRSLKV